MGHDLFIEKSILSGNYYYIPDEDRLVKIVIPFQHRNNFSIRVPPDHPDFRPQE